MTDKLIAGILRDLISEADALNGISKVVNVAEVMGLVTVARSLDDDGGWILKLTDAGRAALKAAP